MTDSMARPASRSAGAFSPADDKQWASFAHFGGVLGVIPALLTYVVLRDRGSLTREESKEALNWQITFAIGLVALNLVVTVLAAIIWMVTGANSIPLLVVIPFLAWVGNAVFSIKGGVAVNAGGSYRYPVSVRLVR